jgi:hypothetical protein
LCRLSALLVRLWMTSVWKHSDVVNIWTEGCCDNLEYYITRILVTCLCMCMCDVSPGVVWVTKARKGEPRNAYRILTSKPLAQHPLSKTENIVGWHLNEFYNRDYATSSMTEILGFYSRLGHNILSSVAFKLGLQPKQPSIQEVNGQGL